MTYEQRIRKASAELAAMDEIDKSFGQATPADAGAFALFMTAMTALEAGLKTSDLDCIAQGYVMLEQFSERFDVVSIPRHLTKSQRAVMAAELIMQLRQRRRPEATK